MCVALTTTTNITTTQVRWVNSYSRLIHRYSGVVMMRTSFLILADRKVVRLLSYMIHFGQY